MSDGKVIKVKRVPKKNPKRTHPLDTLAELCYYYPAYTLAAARRLPHAHVKRMLGVAKHLEVSRYYNLTQIASAPHTEGGKGVIELLSKYEDIMNG